MRLLLDEMYPPVLAEQLRRAGHDAVSVTENADLTGLDDAAICDLAVSTGRAVVTENAVDFLRIIRQRTAVGQRVPTLIVTSNRSFPRHSASFIGRAAKALSSFGEQHAGGDTEAGIVHWLRPVP